MAIGDVLAGLGEASHEYHTNLLKMDYQRRAELAQMYGKLAEDQSYPEEMRAEALKRAITIHSTPYDKKIPKEFESMTFTVPAKSGTPQEQPGKLPMGTPGAPMGLTPPPSEPPSMPAHQASFEPMPFNERISRLGQESEAKSMGAYGIAGMKASIPTKQTVKIVQGDDGRRYQVVTYQRRNPDTGQMEQFDIQSDKPQGFFAPRSGAEVTAGELAQWVQEGYLSPPLTQEGKPLDIGAIARENPGALWQSIGEDRYVPKTESKSIRSIGGVDVPVGRVTGNVGAPIGISTSMIPRTTTSSSEHTIQMPGNKFGRVTLDTSSTRTPVYPQGMLDMLRNPAAAPTLPPGSNGAPQGRVTTSVNSPVQGKPPAISMIGPPPPAPPKPQSRGGAQEIPGAGRSLTPEQIVENEKRADAYKNTLERMNNIIDTFESEPDMQNFMKRLKLSIVADPKGKLGLTVANAADLTPKEQQFAADYISLGEDINVMRGIFGATGFRSKEAFEQLLGQRGNLLGNPKVFSKTLKNSLQSVLTQMVPMAKGLAENGHPVPVTDEIMKAYLILNNNDDTKALSNMKRDGWKVD